MSGFFGRFVEREGVACLETAQLSGFGFPSRKTPSFSYIVACEGLETDSGVWISAWKLKILRRLRLFRLVVTGVGRLQPASVSCCKHGAPILSRDHSGEPIWQAISRPSACCTRQRVPVFG